ncbi:hypothetical protein [Rhizobacter sp. Root1221]|uniref:hypothetical protein n=1 Tax=Rhizobacter sp. Root1221 TaxID=1736433 RepID=UPI0006F9ED14|nr:hypothetical protein [Rhizobacter sp. Root1221]KQW02200.1 hypothetical protein ASC87_13290 [Rhizobacter sp. Root1221]
MNDITTTIELVLKSAQVIGVCYAALKVAGGVEAWRSEYVGKRRTDLAESVLVKFFHVREVLHEIRPTEKAASDFAGVVGTRLGAMSTASMLMKRVDDNTGLLSEFYALKPSFLAHFPGSADDPFHLVRRAVAKIRSTASEIEFCTDQNQSPNQDWSPHSYLAGLEAKLVRGGKEDEITELFERAERLLTGMLVPHIAPSRSPARFVRDECVRVWGVVRRFREKTGAVKQTEEQG